MAVDISNEEHPNNRARLEEGPPREQVNSSMDLAAFVKDRWKQGQDAIREQQHNYWLNAAFLDGQQWLWYDPGDGRLDELPRDPERVRAVINRLWPATRSIISNLVQRELVFEVALRDADDAHRRGAKLGEAILRAVHDQHDWEVKREILAYAAWKGGTAAVCVDWDSDAGNVIADDIEGGGTLKDGDTIETVLTISEFVTEPGARDAERAFWWIKAQTLPPREVQAMFDLDWLPKPDGTAGLSPFQHRLMVKNRTGSDELVDLTMVLTYYERPNPRAPKGRIIQVVNDVVVNGKGKGEDWYFPWEDRLNIAVGRETPCETHWTGKTVLTEARPVQVLFNAAWSSIVEHMKLAGNARLMVPEGAIDLIEEFSDLPGEVIPYPIEGGSPSYLSPPQLPSWLLDAPRALADEIDDILGFHDISRGAAPANIESGYGLSILAEKDATPVGRMSKEFARVWSRVSSMVLQCYEKFATQTRTTTVDSPDLPVVSLEWNGKDLAGQTNVYVPLDAVLPRSRAAMMQMAKDMLAAGLIMDVVDFAAVAELPGQHDMLKVIQPDVARAQRENAGFVQGRQSIPFDWDDHSRHIQEHNKFRKTLEYELLDEDDRDMVDAHIEAHATLAAEMLAEQRESAMLDPALPGIANPNENPLPDDMQASMPAGMPMPPDVVPGAGLPPLPPAPENPGTIDGATVANDIFAAMSDPMA